ncbi:MAG: phosphoglycerate dehydrogenase [Phycisphaerales bacterium]|nr:MAG: phosphoglycerate dehydrogenase [Phycisphaerales bacterium]
MSGASVASGPGAGFPKRKIVVELFESVHDDGVAMLREAGFDVRTHAGSPDGSAIAEAARSAHVLGVRSKTTLPAELLAGATKLLAIGCFCIGTDQVDLDAARARGVPVFNAPFSNTRSVAELTIAEVIALHRRLFEQSTKMHAGAWDKSAGGAHEIRGRTLGIVGYGHIGAQVSVLAEAMGMRVIFCDTQAKLALGNAEQVSGLDELLARADVVTLHVPSTGSTRGLIGKAQLEKMKPGAFLINNARGSVVDVAALASALQSGRLAGAALDVFPEEPRSRGEAFESELRGLPNVILTPHIGGSTEEAQGAIARDVATKLIRFVNVGATTGAVNMPEVDLAPQPALGGDKPRPVRVLHTHRNVPGVMRSIHEAIGATGANVWGEHLETSGDIGYVVLDADPTDGEALAERLRGVAETIRVRVLY